MNWVIIILLVVLFLEIEALKRQRILIVRENKQETASKDVDVIDEIDELIEEAGNEGDN